MWDNRSTLRLLAVPRQLLEEPQLGWGVPSWDDAWDGGVRALACPQRRFQCSHCR